jgi:hypothetical protein
MTKTVNMSMAIPMIAIIMIAAAIATLAVSGKLFSYAYACETNAKGCIEQGGPGQSGVAPPEVSGCHVFVLPADECTRNSTPP